MSSHSYECLEHVSRLAEPLPDEPEDCDAEDLNAPAPVLDDTILDARQCSRAGSARSESPSLSFPNCGFAICLWAICGLFIFYRPLFFKGPLGRRSLALLWSPLNTAPDPRQGKGAWRSPLHFLRSMVLLGSVLALAWALGVCSQEPREDT